MEDFFNQYSGTIAALSLLVAVLALIIAYVALKDQKKSRFTVEALPMVASNNDKYFGFNTESQLVITNRGNKPITITEVFLCIGKERIPIPQTTLEKINIYIGPGQIQYFTYDRNQVVDRVTAEKYKKNYVVCWLIMSSENKVARCKTENRVFDFINVNDCGDEEDDQT